MTALSNADGLSQSEARNRFRALQLQAYAELVSTLRVQGPLGEASRELLEKFRETFGITSDRHKAECRRAVNDGRLAALAKCLSGVARDPSWIEEGKRAFKPLPRQPPQHAFTHIADKAARLQAEINATLPSRGKRKHSQSQAAQSIDPQTIPPVQIAPPPVPAKQRKRSQSESSSSSSDSERSAYAIPAQTTPLVSPPAPSTTTATKQQQRGKPVSRGKRGKGAKGVGRADLRRRTSSAGRGQPGTEKSRGKARPDITAELDNLPFGLFTDDTLSAEQLKLQSNEHLDYLVKSVQSVIASQSIPAPSVAQKMTEGTLPAATPSPSLPTLEDAATAGVPAKQVPKTTSAAPQRARHNAPPSSPSAKIPVTSGLPRGFRILGPSLMSSPGGTVSLPTSSATPRERVGSATTLRSPPSNPHLTNVPSRSLLSRAIPVPLGPSGQLQLQQLEAGGHLQLPKASGTAAGNPAQKFVLRGDPVRTIPQIVTLSSQLVPSSGSTPHYLNVGTAGSLALGAGGSCSSKVLTQHHVVPKSVAEQLIRMQNVFKVSAPQQSRATTAVPSQHVQNILQQVALPPGVGQRPGSIIVVQKPSASNSGVVLRTSDM